MYVVSTKTFTKLFLLSAFWPMIGLHSLVLGPLGLGVAVN